MATVEGRVSYLAPARHKSNLVIDDTSHLVRNFPLQNVKRGEPLWVLVCFRNLSMALRGQVNVPVLHMRMTADWQYRSVFDVLCESAFI